MNSEPRPEFWEAYHRLPANAKAQARKGYALFMADPGHPSLRFKPLRGYEGVWSVRVGQQGLAQSKTFGGACAGKNAERLGLRLSSGAFA